MQEIHQKATEENNENNYVNGRGKNMKRLIESQGEDWDKQQEPFSYCEETLDKTAPLPPPPKKLNFEQAKANLKGIYLI